jgi:peptide deformylase
MTKDDIIALPNPHLRQKSKRVGIITDEIKQVVQDMQDATIDWDLSREHEVGVALAAVQIDRLYKIVIVRNNYDDKEDHGFTVFINPEIAKALDLDGKEFRVSAEGFLARIFQHEIDHTNGLVFIDHIKDQPEAFFRLNDEGKLEDLDYEKDVEKNPILW